MALKRVDKRGSGSRIKRFPLLEFVLIGLDGLLKAELPEGSSALFFGDDELSSER